jgi:hypothetical protein
MSRIDRALVSIDWELRFPNSMLQAISFSVSDHTPLHLSMNTKHNSCRWFRFELFGSILMDLMRQLRRVAL